MTDEQGDKIIALLDNISDKLSDLLHKHEELIEIIEPWQQSSDALTTDSEQAGSTLAAIKLDVGFLVHVAQAYGKKYLDMIWIDASSGYAAGLSVRVVIIGGPTESDRLLFGRAAPKSDFPLAFRLP